MTIISFLLVFRCCSCGRNRQVALFAFKSVLTGVCVCVGGGQGMIKAALSCGKAALMCGIAVHDMIGTISSPQKRRGCEVGAK